jgi:hypothetical protein
MYQLFNTAAMCNELRSSTRFPKALLSCHRCMTYLKLPLEEKIGKWVGICCLGSREHPASRSLRGLTTAHDR